MEHYKKSFPQLVEELGHQEAMIRVDYYLELSRKYQDTKTFVVHSFQLLMTYKAGNGT